MFRTLMMLSILVLPGAMRVVNMSICVRAVGFESGPWLTRIGCMRDS